MWTQPSLTSLHSPPRHPENSVTANTSGPWPECHGSSWASMAGSWGITPPQPPHPCQVPQQDRVAATTSSSWKTPCPGYLPSPFHLLARFPGITSHTNGLHSNLSLRVSIWYNEQQCTVLLGVRGAKIRRTCAEKTHNLTGKAIHVFKCKNTVLHCFGMKGWSNKPTKGSVKPYRWLVPPQTPQRNRELCSGVRGDQCSDGSGPCSPLSRRDPWLLLLNCRLYFLHAG